MGPRSVTVGELVADEFPELSGLVEAPQGTFAKPVWQRPRPRVISADHLKLALVARRVRPKTRWAAMSDGAATSSCKPGHPGGGYCVHQPPLLQPLTAGRMQALFDRVRSHGRAEVLRTWRTSIAVLKAEFSSCVLRAQPRAAL